MNKDIFTPAKIKEIENKELNYNKAEDFFHCKYCIEQFLVSELHKTMTPREYGMYEVSSYVFTYPRGKKGSIIVVWCKRCGRSIWDSRNLVARY